MREDISIEGESQRRETSLRDFLRVIFKYKWVLLILFLVSTGVVAMINMRDPVLYESEARVLVRRGQLESMIDARYRYLTWEEEVLSELEAVKSHSVLSRARDILKEKLEEAGMDTRPLIARGYVEAAVVKESNVLAISYLHRDPVYVRMVCNAVTEAYMEYRENTYDVRDIEDFFSEQIEGVEREIEELRGTRADFVRAQGLTFSPYEMRHLEVRLNEAVMGLDDLRQKIEAKQSVLKAEKDALESGFTTRIPRDPHSSYGDMEVIFRHKLNLAELRSERDALAAQFTNKYPPLAALNSRIAVLENELRNEVIDKIRLDELDLELLKGDAASHRRTIQETEAILATLADKEGEYKQMQLKIDALQERYKELRESQIQTKVSHATRPAWRVTLITPASRPFARKTKDYVRMALAPIFSVVVGLVLISFVESLDHSIKDPEDAESVLGLPVLASLWEMKKGRL